jgi:exodeoxyribonuclease V beta subunit
MEDSALCYLLHGDALPKPAGLTAALESLSSEGSKLAVKQYPDTFSRPNLQVSRETEQLAAARFKGKIDTSWQITSFSRLTANHDQQPERPDYDQVLDETPQLQGHDVFGFPKGAAAGTCLHSILELIDFTNPAGHEEIIKMQLARAGFSDSWNGVVCSWMQAVLATELEANFSLACLQERDRINEMSFYFPLQSMNLHSFNRTLEDFSIPSLSDQHETLQGLMVGFIDLVYRYDNRYYVADYKSNHLGSLSVDYGRMNMQTAMLEHRYDLQYLIYTLALHRFLAGRIRGYDYDTHFGGVSYLFLRGMDPKNEPGTGVFVTRPDFTLIDQLDKCCAGQEEK